MLLAMASAAPAGAADVSCDGLVVTGQADLLELRAELGAGVHLLRPVDERDLHRRSSGNDIETTPGTVTFTTQDPWAFTTSHGIAGSISQGPGVCTDESGAARDYGLTPTALPPGSPNVQMHPFCCRME